MTSEKLEELRRIAEAATPGPEEIITPNHPVFDSTTVLALLDEIERLRRGRETAKKAVAAMSDRCPKCGVEQPKPIAIEGPWLYYGDSFHEIDGNDCIRRQLEQAKAEIERLRREREVLAEAVMAWEEYRNAALGSIAEVEAVAKLHEAHMKALALIDGEKGSAGDGR